MLNFDWSIFWTIFNLLVLLVLLKKFLFGPITKMMEGRTAEIEESLQQAEEKNAQAEAKMAEYDLQLKDAQAQAAQIVTDAKGRAQNEYDRILKAAQSDAQKAAEQGRRQIALEREQMLGQVKDSMAEIVLLTAAKLSEQRVEKDGDRQFVDAFLSELEVRP